MLSIELLLSVIVLLILEASLLVLDPGLFLKGPFGVAEFFMTKGMFCGYGITIVELKEDLSDLGSLSDIFDPFKRFYWILNWKLTLFLMIQPIFFQKIFPLNYFHNFLRGADIE